MSLPSKNSYHIQFLNRAHQTIEVTAEQNILDVALDAGIPISFGCLYGDCTTCISWLVEGEVAQPQATGLTPSQREQGMVLLCVASPRSHCKIHVGYPPSDSMSY